MVLIYVPTVNSRLRYIFNVLLKQLWGIYFEFTSDISRFQAYEGPRFSYTEKPLGKELFFASHKLLFEKNMQATEADAIDFKHTKGLFPVFQDNSCLSFDPFAASFYMLSRYEEYLPFRRDAFGRFKHEDSIATKNHFLQQPVVNIWSEEMVNILKIHFPGLKTRTRKYTFQPSYDIDVPYAYKEKGLIRSIGGYLKSFIKGNWQDISERTQVLSGNRPDPYDTYSYQFELHRKYDIHPLYFILIGDYSTYDKSPPFQLKGFRELIKKLNDYGSVGIHPSFASIEKPVKLQKELKRLQTILHQDIINSRQHFLRITIPHAYRNLLNEDIFNDYSMGYAGQPGFRAGICDPFPFYDLDIEAETPLNIHPFMVMDGSLKDYLKLSPEKALDHTKAVIDATKKAEGQFISLWHNESLCECGRWKGWRKMYSDMFDYAAS